MPRLSAALPTHVSLRPQIVFVTVPPDPCRGILSTFEVLDTASGRTDIIIPQEPFIPPNPVFPVRLRFGFADTTSADALRLSVVNAALAAREGVCKVEASFANAAGDVLQTQTASLAAGQSLILPDQPGGSLLRPIVRFAPGDACRGIIATVEMVAAAADRTRFFIPPDPIRGRGELAGPAAGPTAARLPAR